MFKKLKNELFYLQRMIQFGYGPKGFLKYFKNKFRWPKLLEKLPKYQCVPKNDFELHTLSQKQMLWGAIWGLISFMHFSGLSPKIIIHDDGSIDKETAELVESKFNNVKVLLKKEADKMIEKLDVPQLIKDFRNNKNKLIFKLTDVFLLSNSDKVMFLDSDILFFDRLNEIIDFINDKNNLDAVISRSKATYPLSLDDDYLKKYNLIEKEANKMNSGIMAYKKDKMPLEKLVEYFKHTLEPEGYFIEMAGWSSLIAQTNFAFLPAEKYIIKGSVASGVVAKHFTSPRRHELYAYGIDLVREKIGI